MVSQPERPAPLHKDEGAFFPEKGMKVSYSVDKVLATAPELTFF